MEDHTKSIPSNLSVCVRSATKSYGGPERILDGLNMSVAQGSIYGLLGASGCGKTTLLSCIVGRKRLNEGSMWVLGGTPGSANAGVPGPRVGYMPQDVALVGELTIRETVFYFGWIFGMEDQEIEERFQFVHKLLDLPVENRFIKFLSGGQQRRVSLACAIVHEPELLVLDEPTVGLDPVLRQGIWDHLVESVRDRGQTIIITTHYIEEARQAHCIGLMRSGRLLAEASPSSLMQRFSANTLEDVFLELSAQQDGAHHLARQPAEVSAISPTLPDEPVGNAPTPTPLVHMGGDAMPMSDMKGKHRRGRPPPSTATAVKGRIRALLAKSFLRVFRHLGALGFIFIFPILEVGVFFTAIGGDPKGLRLAVVNDELAAWNITTCDQFNTLYGKPGVYDVFEGGGALRAGLGADILEGSGNGAGNGNDTFQEDFCSYRLLSCAFLQYLDKNMSKQVFFAERKTAMSTTESGETVGVIYFASNFTESLDARRRYGTDTAESDIESGEIPVWLDMSNRQLGTYMTRDIIRAYHDFSKNLLTECKQNSKIGEIPVHFEDPIYGDVNPNFAVFAAPGIILTMIYFLTTGLTATVMISERQEGIWDRSLVAGVEAWQSLLAHVLTQSVLMGIQATLALVMTFVVFQVPCVGNMVDVILLVFLTGICGMCFGFFVSSTCDSVTAANFFTLGSFYPIVLLSGVIWPLEGMSKFLRWIAVILPATLSTTSLRNIMLRGWDLGNFEVYHGFLMTVFWSITFVTMSLVMLNLRK